ncbi:hypothetical protein [Frankia sp. EAN1pec]|uniref:hypothetical protein n=1 Tax=Parafrankia sp. (strain EAN1pec) TaxID=298653 RepID=UPI0012F7931E
MLVVGWPGVKVAVPLVAIAGPDQNDRRLVSMVRAGPPVPVTKVVAVTVTVTVHDPPARSHRSETVTAPRVAVMVSPTGALPRLARNCQDLWMVIVKRLG